MQTPTESSSRQIEELSQFDRFIAGFLDLLSSNITKMTAIVAALVGLPTSLFSCTDKQIANRTAFQSAIVTEEKRFADLHETLFKTVGTRKTDADTFKAKLNLLCMLSVRPPQTFKDFPLGGWFPVTESEDHKSAALYVQRLQAGFQDSLKREEIGGADGAACVSQREDAVADQETARREPPPSGEGSMPETPPEVSAAVRTQTEIKATVDKPKLISATAATAPSSLVLSAGDSKGYDIDVFWCETGNAEGNFALGSETVSALSKAVMAEPGFPVGRVRLRKLFAAKQKAPGYSPATFEVRGEKSEETQRNSLAKWLTNPKDGTNFTSRETGMKTPWYLSVFICTTS